MAPRPSWKGHLRLSLVSCPVRLYPATSGASRVSFHLLHKDTHKRINMRPYEPDLGEVERSDLVKGYEYEKGHYVVMDQEDFDKAQIESTKTIAIERFVDEDSVDPIYLETPYYLAPDGDFAEETFGVIREAMPSVPIAQATAAPSIASTPKGAATTLCHSGSNRAISPASPKASASSLAAVMRSRPVAAAMTAAQIGMVKPMMLARPAAMRLTP